MANLVAKLFDPELDVSAVDETQLIERVHDLCHARALSALAVTHFKRRLGYDVTDGDLRNDKKIARRTGSAIALVCAKCRGQRSVREDEWAALRDEAHDGEIMAGSSVLRWDTWLANVIGEMHREAVFCATWCVKVNVSSFAVKKITAQLHACSRELARIRTVALTRAEP